MTLIRTICFASLLALLAAFIFALFSINKPDLGYTHWTQKYNDQKFTVVKVDSSNAQNLEFFYKNTANEKYVNFENLKNDLAQTDRKLLFATNGGIFSEQFEPLGLYVENGTKINDINYSTVSTGNFFIQPNGMFGLNNEGGFIVETAKYLDVPNVKNAIQSGPMLVTNNIINSKFKDGSTNKYIRNGVGIDNSGNIYFVLSRQLISLYDFAEMFKDELNCPNALYLDGSISDMYIKNKPIRNSQREFSTMIGIAK